MIKIMFVCYGNICRSTMAEFIMKRLVQDKGDSDRFFIASAGTSDEELGNPVHRGTRAVLDGLGISYAGKRATKLKKSDYENYDYFIGMDGMNRRDMLRIFGQDKEDKIRLLLDFTARGGEVADPWYTGDFNATYIDVKEGTEALYEFLTADKD